MSQPQKQDCHTLQLVDLARPFLVSPAIKIEIENSLEMAPVQSEKRFAQSWQSHRDLSATVWNLAIPARNTKLFVKAITQISNRVNQFFAKKVTAAISFSGP